MKKQTLKQSDALKRRISKLKVGDKITVQWLDPTHHEEVRPEEIDNKGLTLTTEIGAIIRLDDEVIKYCETKDEEKANIQVLPYCLIVKLKKWR